jgi:hypothetical protein
MEMSSQLHAPTALIPGKDPGTHWIGGWMELRAGLDAVEKRKNPNPRRPACSIITTLTELLRF